MSDYSKTPEEFQKLLERKKKPLEDWTVLVLPETAETPKTTFFIYNWAGKVVFEERDGKDPKVTVNLSEAFNFPLSELNEPTFFRRFKKNKEWIWEDHIFFLRELWSLTGISSLYVYKQWRKVFELTNTYPKSKDKQERLFAGFALMGMLASHNEELSGDLDPETCADTAFKFAAEMMDKADKLEL